MAHGYRAESHQTQDFGVRSDIMSVRWAFLMRTAIPGPCRFPGQAANDTKLP